MDFKQNIPLHINIYNLLISYTQIDAWYCNSILAQLLQAKNLVCVVNIIKFNLYMDLLL